MPTAKSILMNRFVSDFRIFLALEQQQLFDRTGSKVTKI